jgi:putative transposase
LWERPPGRDESQAGACSYRYRGRKKLERDSKKLRPRPHQKNLRLGRRSEESRAYSLTKCAQPGMSLTVEPSVAATLIDTLFWMNDHGRLVLGAFVIMPDHFHVVASLGHLGLKDVMKQIGSFTARKINQIFMKSGRIWQAGYYDRGIRKSEDIREIFDYVHNNPVRRGLVTKPEEWPFSSLNREYYSKISWDLFV